MDNITQVTDEMLIQSFQTHEKLGLLIGTVSLVFVVIFLMVMRVLIKKSKEEDKNDEEKKGASKLGWYMMGLLMLLMFSIAGTRVGLSEFWTNYRAEKKGYIVSLEIVEEKIKARKNRGHEMSPNYMIFSSLGKQKINDKYYREFHEDDIVYVVFSADGKVMKVLNTTEYMYVGDHS